MPQKYVKSITSPSELQAAMRNSLKQSITLNPPPSFPLPAKLSQLPGSKTTGEENGSAVLKDLVQEFLAEQLGLSGLSGNFFCELSVGVITESIPLILQRIANHSGFKLSARGIKDRSRAFFILLGRGELDTKLFLKSLETHLEEFPHLYQRWHFLPSDHDGSPESVGRHMETFRIPEFQRKEEAGHDSNSKTPLVLRRSQRISSKLDGVTLSTASIKRFALTGPVTPLKRNRNAEVEPEEARVIKKSKLSKPARPQRKENGNQTIGAPLKALGAKAKRTFGVGVSRSMKDKKPA
ncbi:hypothetical protein BT96DRAFT_923242 [Gymnopus androsaceus JB14]|uniref:Uncharacterized protein n=1 Tax=Gymnopus androsaceus JB14 TaxID=1447944 RepID=A0A6A4HA28_9AGAR|nr:hypothetical protein BT96DRAFT_923242 [Gymnopus androsaceus JB14]